MDVQLVGSPVKPTLKQAWERCRNAFNKCQLTFHAEFVACLLPTMLMQFCDVVVFFVGSIYGGSALCIRWLPCLRHFEISLGALQ